MTKNTSGSLCGKTQGVRSREIVEYRRENDLVLSECDVSVRLSRGAALITRWLDAESKIMVLGTTSSKWPGLSPPEWPANCPSTLTILTFARNLKKTWFFYWKFLLRIQNDCLVLVNYSIYCMFSLLLSLHFISVLILLVFFYLTHEFISK